MKRWSFLLLLLWALAAIGCYSSDPVAANDPGSGTEIVGRVEYGDTTADTTARVLRKTAARFRGFGIPAVGVMIFIYPESVVIDTNKRPEDYLPRAHTGSDGSFRITNVPAGVWVLEANDGEGARITRKVEVPGDSITIDVGTLVLPRIR